MISPKLNPELPKETMYIDYLTKDITGKIPVFNWQIRRMLRLCNLENNPRIVTSQVESHLETVLRVHEKEHPEEVSEAARLLATAKLTGTCALRYVIKADTGPTNAMDVPTLHNVDHFLEPFSQSKISANQFIDGWAPIVTTKLFGVPQEKLYMLEQEL